MATVESTRFGTLELQDGDVLEFPAGLIGLPGNQYVLVCTDAESPFRWLQCADDASLALPVTSPWSFFPDYDLVVSDADAQAAGIGAADSADVDVWVTVRASSELGDFSANLRAPILIHDGRGHQVINEAPHAPVRAPLFTPEAGDRAA